MGLNLSLIFLHPLSPILIQVCLFAPLQISKQKKLWGGGGHLPTQVGLCRYISVSNLFYTAVRSQDLTNSLSSPSFLSSSTLSNTYLFTIDLCLVSNLGNGGAVPPFLYITEWLVQEQAKLFTLL
jgi:hypothetical protein